jgi:hypothetical protein
MDVYVHCSWAILGSGFGESWVEEQLSQLGVSVDLAKRW